MFDPPIFQLPRKIDSCAFKSMSMNSFIHFAWYSEFMALPTFPVGQCKVANSPGGTPLGAFLQSIPLEHGLCLPTSPVGQGEVANSPSGTPLLGAFRARSLQCLQHDQSTLRLP